MTAEPGASPRVLIVEDDEAIAFVMKETLADAGLDVVALAADRDSALLAAQAYAPDVALVDIALADGETGVALAATLSEQGIDCIFVTARHDGLAGASALGVLHKPVRPDELTTAVRYALALREGGLAPDPPTYLRLFRAGHPAR